MSRAPQTFRQRDVCAAIRAVLQAGREVVRVEINKGGTITLVVTTSCREAPANEADAVNEWDDLLK